MNNYDYDYDYEQVHPVSDAPLAASSAGAVGTKRMILVKVEVSNPNDGTEYDELPPGWDQMNSLRQREWLARVESDFLAEYAGAAASIVEVDEQTSEPKPITAPADSDSADSDDKVLVSKADLVACFAQETPLDFALAVSALNRVLRAAGIRTP